MDSDVKLQTPPGLRDWPPGNAWKKRWVEDKLALLFKKWGYREVITGTLEFENLIGRGLSEEEKGQLYRFFGREGEVLTLRPDMTTPIARLVASQLRNDSLPLRLFYIANVFRHEKVQAGRYREFYQAGIELIGSDSPRADAEIIILAGESLCNLGLEDFKIGIGQVQLLDSMLESSSLPQQTRTQLKGAMGRKDYVTLETIVNQAGLGKEDRELLGCLASIMHEGEFERSFEIIARRSPVEAQAQRMQEVLEFVSCAGFSDRVFVDLGITRDFEYYTGMVFEIFCPRLGFPLCGGGRYDRLLQQFGFDCPATGFALGVERILLVLEEAGSPGTDQGVTYLIGGRDFRSVLKRAGELRAAGEFVEVDVTALTADQLERKARKRGIYNCEYLGGEEDD